MTTKTIPACLEDERKKDEDAQQRIEEEAARVQVLRHGHQRTAKHHKLDLPSGKTAATAMKKARTARKKARKVRTAA